MEMSKSILLFTDARELSVVIQQQVGNGTYLFIYNVHVVFLSMISGFCLETKQFQIKSTYHIISSHQNDIFFSFSVSLLSPPPQERKGDKRESLCDVQSFISFSFFFFQLNTACSHSIDTMTLLSILQMLLKRQSNWPYIRAG